MKVYTLGTSLRDRGEFLSILKFYGITCVCDVRRFPVSRLSYFEGERLKEFLKENGIGYVYFGSSLGGYRKEGYRAYMEKRAFKKGIESLLDLIKKGKVCLICAERLPFRCHRRFIGRALEEKGVEVVHIIEKEKVWSRLEKKKKADKIL